MAGSRGHILLHLIWSVFIMTVLAACPYKECSCSGNQITCSNRGLTSMPPLVTGSNDTGFTVLALDVNKITSIHSGSLPPGLVEVTLSHVPLATIEDGALNGSYSTLTSLLFDGANFSRIPDEFSRLDNLQYLTMYNSVVRDWNYPAMVNVGRKMYNLFLQNVGITSWPSWVSNFTQVAQLSFYDCSIPSIPDDGLDHLDNVNLLSIINCSLTSVPKTVTNLKSLQLLQLLRNSITDMTWLPRSWTFSSLNLNMNNISDPILVATSLLQSVDHLKYVDLRKNLLTVIPELYNITGLSELNLSYNLINDTQAGSVPATVDNLFLTGNLFTSIPRIYFNATGVSYMHLGFNKISDIRDSHFPIWIDEANLESNLITELTNSSFPENSSLSFVVLNGNPLVRIHELAFQYLTQLVDLNLQQTQLTRLPLALGHLTGLKLLDARDNPSLVCTCDESSLRSWADGLLTLAGNCGVTSITDFFTRLSPQCPV